MDKQLALTQETQSQTAQHQMDLSSPSSSDVLASQQRMRAFFVESQEQRLHKLISEGHISVGSHSIVWVDENGLVKAQNMNGDCPSYPMPFFHAGADADVNQISKSLTMSRYTWGQELGKSTCVMSSLLENLVMKEIKYLPNNAHLAWKKLLADLESSTATHTPTSLMFDKLKEAIAEVNDDWIHFDRFVALCQGQEEPFDMDLDTFSEALYRITGIDVSQSDPWIALRELDEGLADEIFTLCHLAKKVQTGEFSLDQISCLPHLAVGLRETLWEREIAERMEQLLKAVEAKAVAQP